LLKEKIMTATANNRKPLISAVKLLSTTIMASLFLFPVESASANCQVSSEALEVVELTNQVRTQHGLEPLHLNCQLYEASQNHTADMAKTGNLSHTGSDGYSVDTRLKRVGYQYSSAAENIAYGQEEPSQVLNSWMNSPGHRENILNPSHTDIGVGFLNNYWTQVFGRAR
jgi:uncharacterized protein YkwD